MLAMLKLHCYTCFYICYRIRSKHSTVRDWEALRDCLRVSRHPSCSRDAQRPLRATAPPPFRIAQSHHRTPMLLSGARKWWNNVATYNVHSCFSLELGIICLINYLSIFSHNYNMVSSQHTFTQKGAYHLNF